jgi:hypothetical protein
MLRFVAVILIRMEHIANKIYIYKTSVNNKIDRRFIARALDPILGETNWTIDLTDEDKVLRVQSKDDNTSLIIDVLSEYGFFCEQMHYSL